MGSVLYSTICFDARWTPMLELLIQLFCVFIWTCFMSLCIKQKEEKSEGRMPGSSVQHESMGKKSEPLSPTRSGSNEGIKAPPRKTFYRDRKRKFTKEENEGRSESAPEKRSSDERTDRKSEEKEKKEKKDVAKKDEKNIEKAVGAVDRKSGEQKAKPATDGKLHDEKTQMTFSVSRPPSARDMSSLKEVTAVHAIPGDTLALLAAAEQMALDKGDYDNFGPPAPPKLKEE